MTNKEDEQHDKDDEVLYQSLRVGDILENGRGDRIVFIGWSRGKHAFRAVPMNKKKTDTNGRAACRGYSLTIRMFDPELAWVRTGALTKSKNLKNLGKPVFAG
jgi:hypothetical protein